MHLKTKYSTKLKVTGQMTNTDLQQCDTAKTSQIIAAALVRGTAFNLTLNGKKTHLDFFIGIQSIRYRCIAERNYEHRKTKRGPCKNALVQLSKNITFI